MIVILKEAMMTKVRQSSLVPYGEELDRLMRRRGLRNVAQLSRFLKHRGISKGVAQQTLSYHMLGRTQPRAALVERILDALEANEEERIEVRRAFWETSWGTNAGQN